MVASLQIPRDMLLIALWVHLGLPQPSAATYLACDCRRPLHSLGASLLRCLNGDGSTAAHNAVRDAVASNALEARFRVGCEHVHQLPRLSSRGAHQRVDLRFMDECSSKSLADVLVANRTRRGRVSGSARPDSWALQPVSPLPCSAAPTQASTRATHFFHRRSRL